jgi:hypothetical protein
MIKSPAIVDSTITGYTFPATYRSEPLDLGPVGSNLASFHIVWRDVGLTFYLWRANSIGVLNSAPPWDDWTVDYRALDPAWVDPVIGDPLSEHIVAAYNIGARYVRIGWSASDWSGPNRLLQIILYGESRVT